MPDGRPRQQKPAGHRQEAADGEGLRLLGRAVLQGEGTGASSEPGEGSKFWRDHVGGYDMFGSLGGP